MLFLLFKYMSFIRNHVKELCSININEYVLSFVSKTRVFLLGNSYTIFFICYIILLYYVSFLLFRYQLGYIEKDKLLFLDAIRDLLSYIDSLHQQIVQERYLEKVRLQRIRLANLTPEQLADYHKWLEHTKVLDAVFESHESDEVDPMAYSLREWNDAVNKRFARK